MDIINSERLSYRLMDANDADLLFELDQDPEVMRHITGGKIPSMEDVLNTQIPRMNAYVDQQKGWGLWAVNLIEDNTFIGWILVRPMNFFSDNPEWDNLELGWRFFQRSWGKGFATEAARHIADMVTDNQPIKRICAIALEDNLASISIMEKLGMEYIKTYMHHDKHLGNNQVVYYEKCLSKVMA